MSTEIPLASEASLVEYNMGSAFNSCLLNLSTLVDEVREEIDGLDCFVIEEQCGSSIKLGDGGHIFLGQAEILDVDILLDTIGMDGLCQPW